MTRSLLTGILALGVGSLGHAADTSASYDIQAGGGYESLDVRGTKGRVLQYDGKEYHTGRGDLQFSSAGERGLFDLEAHDLGSGEENGRLDLDYKDTVRLSGYVSNLHHRQPLVRTLVTVNNQPTTNPYLTDNTRREDLMFRRLEGGLTLMLRSAKNQARHLSLGYWAVSKVGDQDAKYNGIAYPAFVDNLTQDVTVGVGTNLGDKGAVTNDVVVRSFLESAQLVSLGGTNYTKRPHPNQSVYSDELRLRYDLTKGLALTGVLNGRERQNRTSGYYTRAFMANVAASYQASKKLSLTARIYSRYQQVYENQQYLSPRGGSGNGNEFDQNALKTELSGSYRITDKVRTRAQYKMEWTHRRDAPVEMFQAVQLYHDGYFIDGNTNWQSNALAKDDTKHTFNASATAELPLRSEVELSYQKLLANRAAFENQPTDRDAAGLSFTLPLPRNVSFTAGADYIKERNRTSNLSHYNQVQHTLRAGLEWDASQKVSVGADYSRDRIVYKSDGWFGITNSPVAGYLEGGFLVHEGSMANRQTNDTAGAHARVVLPKGFLARGNASYTRSIGQVATTQFTPTTLPANAAAAGGFTPAGTNVTDLAPSDVRIWRTGLALEYTPEKLKHLTARASYRVDDWVDRLDSNNSGRASIYAANVSAKF